jgi:glutathione synthase/RimK-type ligase-like ATP-grasp enzyme
VRSSGQIVIITNRKDPHSDVIVRKLAAAGHPVVRLNTDDIPGDVLLDVCFGAETWSGRLRLANGRVIELREVRSVLVRRPQPYVFPDDLDPLEKAFANEETKHAFAGLWGALDCHWVSRPESIRAAGWKPEQLQRAARLGFAVPRTIISTDPAAVRDFYAACAGKVVVKSMSGPAALAAAAHSGVPVPPVDLSTRLVGKEDLGRLDGVRLSPCLLQEYIPKEVEIRATVVEDEVFAAEIHSQGSAESTVDFRRGGAAISCARTVLPAVVEELCVRLVRSYGLNFSALDIIRTPDGRFVFLENNPVGQFMFIERRVPELRITDALVGSLVRAGRSV